MHAIEKHLIENLTRTVSRRTLLKGGLAAGFTLAFHLPLHAADEMDQPAKCPQDFAPNGFIRVGHSGKTTLTMPQVEMGQGVYTAIPQILAERLDADYAKVALEHAPPSDKLYGNPNRSKFAGAVAAGWHAFNITSDRGTGIGAGSDNEIADYLATAARRPARWARPSTRASAC